MRRQTVRILCGVFALTVLTGCTGQGRPPTSAPEPESSAENGDGAAGRGGGDSGVVVEADVTGIPTRLIVGPVVRQGDLSLLRVSVEVMSGEESLSPESAFGFVFRDIGRPRPDNLRLVDTERLTVSLTARTAKGTQAVDFPGQVKAGDGPVAFHPVFAAPEGDTVGVLIPLVGLVEDVPVVEGGSAAAAGVPITVDEVAAGLDVAASDLEPRVYPLESFRELAGGAVRARESEKQLEIAVATDVLFATGSDALSAAADEALGAAVSQVTAYPAGSLVVVGHTDDVASDEFNQDLSERRGASVAARLRQLADLAPYQLSVQGRGESQPAQEGSSDEARALNRRVELLFTPAGEVQDRGGGDAAGATPAPTGPVGTGAAGVNVTDPDRGTARVSIQEVRAVGRLMVGTIRLEQVGPEASTLEWLVTRSAFDARGNFAPSLQLAATGVTLLFGTERVFPLDYQSGMEADRREPLTDMLLNDNVEPGDAQLVTVLWPRLDVDEVVVDVPPITSRGRVIGGHPWRLSDVRVRR